LLIVGFDQRLGVYRQGIFLLPSDVRLTTFRKSVDKENPIRLLFTKANNGSITTRLATPRTCDPLLKEIEPSRSPSTLPANASFAVAHRSSSDIDSDPAHLLNIFPANILTLLPTT